MDSSHWQAIESLFDEVADLPLADRQRRLSVAPAKIREAVERLLASDSQSAAAIRDAIADGEALLASAPGRFGPWRVEGILGHGGMASVFKVVRDDGVYHQAAALKTLQFGHDSPESRQRFRQERQFLASLEHPGIARLIDGGETPDGQPYIVMEYVEGLPVIDFAEQHSLSLLDRLRLFLEICAAVSHAHQSLIAHRDLKPSNILVTPAGQPKLLDFGIAKLIDADAARTATFTLTPQYASPEQIRGEPVTTATDVYSLGLVLYELLTGRKPYRIESNTPSEIDRLVSETPPDPPNLSGDLDNILQMALRKEPKRRYASVGDFAADIERTLTHRPVLARPDSPLYRAGKFLRRNRFPVVAAALLTITLTGGIVASQYQARRAARRFDEVRRLANRFLFDFDAAIAPVAGTTKARELLVSTAVEYLDNLSRESAGDPALQSELAAGYEKLGDVQGRPSQPSLGRFNDALRSYQRASELAQAALASRPADATTLRSLASVTAKIGEIQTWTRKPQEAAQSLAAAAAFAERAIRANPADSDARFLAATIWLRQGDERYNANDTAAALGAFRRSLGAFQELAKANPSTRNRNGVSLTITRLASTSFRLGDLNEARTHYQQAVDIARDLARTESRPGNYHRTLANNLEQFGSILGLPDLTNLGEPVLAETMLREAAAIRESFAAVDPNDRLARHSLVLNRYQLASVVLSRNPAEALRLSRLAQSSVRGEEAMSNIRDHIVRASFVEAQALIALGDLPAALQILDRFGPEQFALQGPPVSPLSVALAKSDIWRKRNQPQTARTVLEPRLKIAEAVPLPDRSLRELRLAAEAHRILAILLPASAAEHAQAERVLWDEWRRRRAPERYIPRRP